MYIAKIAIENFRNFKKTEIEFNDGVNVIIGPNNTGKTNLIKALSLPIDYQGSKRLEIDDFNRYISLEKLKVSPPKISIAITIRQGQKQDFSDKADGLISDLQKRMEEGKKQILSYAKDTGASFEKATPNFEGSLSDIEMFSALRLIVEYETGIKIPATHNGLGYNNLIFMSLLLAKMQVNSDGDYLGGCDQNMLLNYS